MVHLPVGIPGWTVFATGLLVVAYRVHGIDNPRAWIEAMERGFTDKRMLQFAGALVAIAAGALAWFGTPPSGVLGWLFSFSIGTLLLLGIGLVAAQNHVRLLVVATAEDEDGMIRITSGVVTALALVWALAPWFI